MQISQLRLSRPFLLPDPVNPVVGVLVPPFRFPSLRRPVVSTEALALFLSAFFAFACNQQFWAEAMVGRAALDPSTWLFAAALLLALIGIHLLLLCLIPGRWAVKPLWSLLIVATAFATYYMDAYGVNLNPGMLRSVLATEAKESPDLLVGGVALHVAGFAGPPMLALWSVALRRRRPLHALLVRLSVVIGAALIVAVSLLVIFQDLSSLMRNHPEMRYLVSPENFLYSAARAITAETRDQRLPLAKLGPDARLAPSWQARQKPVLFVMVVGETARAANWGLNGYSRQTTPRLAGMEVINFRQVQSCGTDTETSLPCLFSSPRPWRF